MQRTTEVMKIEVVNVKKNTWQKNLEKGKK